MKNKLPLLSPALAGLVFVLLALQGCEDNPTPQEVTRWFWLALHNGQVAEAQQLASSDSRALVQAIPKSRWIVDSLETGEVTFAADGQTAIVATQVDYGAEGQTPRALHFKTYLLLENRKWRVDYRKTHERLPPDWFAAFDELLQGLRIFGEQMQEQLPQLEEDLKSFGEQLNEHLEQFQQGLEKAFPPPQKGEPEAPRRGHGI